MPGQPCFSDSYLFGGEFYPLITRHVIDDSASTARTIEIARECYTKVYFTVQNGVLDVYLNGSQGQTGTGSLPLSDLRYAEAPQPIPLDLPPGKHSLYCVAGNSVPLKAVVLVVDDDYRIRDTRSLDGNKTEHPRQVVPSPPNKQGPRNSYPGGSR